MQRIDTDWTRIFYCDLYAPHAAARDRGERKETAMRHTDSPDQDRPIGRTPLGAALVLLGLYVGMYLAVAGVLHLATPPEAAAAVRREAPAVAAAPSPLWNPLAKHGERHAQTH